MSMINFKQAHSPEAPADRLERCELSDSTRVGVWGRALRWLRRLPRAALENAAAEKEARDLIQALWGIMLVRYPSAFEPRVRSGQEAAAQGLPPAFELARERIILASPKALEIVFRSPGVWSVTGPSVGEDEGETGFPDEWLTAPLILAGMANDSALMALFLEHCDDKATRRSIPGFRLWREAKFSGREASGSDITPLLAATLGLASRREGMTLEAFTLLADRIGVVSPAERLECLRRAPREFKEKMKVYFDRLSIESSTAPANAAESASSRGRL